MKRPCVTVVAAGSLATCPRMVKAADAFSEAGWHVRVVSASNASWAAPFDARLHARRRWRWEPIEFTRRAAPARWLVTGLRSRLADLAAHRLPGRRPWTVTVNAFSRVHAELVAAIVSEPQDLIYGGTTGALAAVAEASRISGIPCGIDFEDFHCGEGEPDEDGALHDELAAVIMADAAGQAAFVTGGSAAIAAACESRFGIPVIPIHNVFALPDGSAGDHARGGIPRSRGPLRLYWFSQTIGPGRGIEDVVRAMGDKRLPGELHLRGQRAAGYIETLERQAAVIAPELRLVVHAPSDPDGMIDACRSFDVGISTEQGPVRNHLLALSNKALTYPLGGLALVVTDTEGQRPLAADLGGQAVVYKPGDVEALGEGLAAWASDPSAVARARAASWEAARSRWHWEHPLERDALLAAAERAA